MSRLTLLAHELSVDGLVPKAGAKAHAKLNEVLDAVRERYADQISAAREAVLTVEGTTMSTSLATLSKTFNDFVTAADIAVINDAYQRAARAMNPEVAKRYVEHLAIREQGHEYDDEALMDARTTVAALGLVPQFKDALEAAADELAKQWLLEHAQAINKLTDERQEAYRLIREASRDPLDVNLARPRGWVQQTMVKEPDGKEIAIPRYERHLMCDPNGEFPSELNGWEQAVLSTEMKRADRLGWYRNPDRACQESLGIVYDDSVGLSILRPDFLFFSQDTDGRVVVDIVDPHGDHLADALPKLQGLARYAETYGSLFRRIEAVSAVDGELRVLDVTKSDVRAAIMEAKAAKAVYVGPKSAVYQTKP